MTKNTSMSSKTLFKEAAVDTKIMTCGKVSEKKAGRLENKMGGKRFLG